MKIKMDLTALNSATKYPSIPTYHTMGDKGRLKEETISFDGTVIGTEKIDGTNARIIMVPDGSYLIGSREELLHARGDLIHNPALGIVAALKEVAEVLSQIRHETITTYYLEVFGGRITAASKNYTSDQSVSFRLFDITDLSADAATLQAPTAQIAAWRDGGGQSFRGEEQLKAFSELTRIPLTPRLFSVGASEIPTSISEMSAFLSRKLPESKCFLDLNAIGNAEGIVLRTPDRRTIAKARFDDYTKILRNKQLHG